VATSFGKELTYATHSVNAVHILDLGKSSQISLSDPDVLIRESMPTVTAGRTP